MCQCSVGAVAVVDSCALDQDGREDLSRGRERSDEGGVLLLWERGDVFFVVFGRFLRLWLLLLGLGLHLLLCV